MCGVFLNLIQDGSISWPLSFFIFGFSAASRGPRYEILLEDSLDRFGPLIITQFWLSRSTVKKLRCPRAIKNRALGRLVEGTGAEVVFSSMPLIAGKNAERSRRTHMSNMCPED